jgi:selenocysteine lyase/cysteine desulfurase
VGAPPASVGVNASVSAAMGAILSAIDFRHRPRVIVSALDFPTLPDILLAYRRKGSIELVVLPQQAGEIPIELYERAVDEQTALVCISSASYATGVQFPIKAVAELCRARGALCLIDAFQSVGALAVDVGQLRPDFLITGTLKYLLGCMGVALIYVAPGLAERLEPHSIGWMAAANPFGTSFDDLEYAPGAARFQAGTFSIPGCYAAEAALDLLLEIGAPAIEARVLRLSRRFADGLSDLCIRPAGPTEVGKLGPMVAVPVHGDSHEWQERLRHEESVIAAARGSSLRFAFHFYNDDDDDDVDACLEVVRRRLSPGAMRTRS